MNSTTTTAFAAGRLPAYGAVSLVTLLLGCHSGGATVKNSQVMATVNDHEITISQLNQVLGGAGGDVTPAAEKQALDSLVDEELLVQDALRDRLDRQPEVVQAMERARRQVIAQAFAEKHLYSRSPPGPTEVEEYYGKNPVLFANRKVFRLTALAISKADLTDAIRAELDKAHGTEQVRESLDRHGVEYETQFMTIAPEQLPLDRLSTFASAAVGDLLTLQQPDGKELLMSVTEVQEAPISLERAKPMIRRYLIAIQRKEALQAYLAQAKSTAKIAYARQASAADGSRLAAPVAGAPAAADSERLANSGATDLH